MSIFLQQPETETPSSLSVVVSPMNILSYSEDLQVFRVPIATKGVGQRLKKVSVPLRCFIVLAAEEKPFKLAKIILSST